MVVGLVAPLGLKSFVIAEQLYLLLFHKFPGLFIVSSLTLCFLGYKLREIKTLGRLLPTRESATLAHVTMHVLFSK